MEKIKLTPPPVFRGTLQEQLQQCRRYLLQLHRQLSLVQEERNK